MTNDTSMNQAVAVDASALAAARGTKYRSKRGRRLMVATLIFLLLLLLIATLFLLNLIRPKGEIASNKDAGGVTWVRSIYGYGPGEDQQLVTPASVAFAKNGDVLIPNVGTVAVRGLRFSSSGTFKNMFVGSPLHKDGTGFIAYPGAVSVAPDGRMYFVQSQRDEVLLLDKNGKKTEGVLKVQRPKSIDVNAERIAVGSDSGWVVTDLDGNPVVGPMGVKGKGKDQYDTVGGIALDEQNNVYVVDSYNNRISKFDPRGKRLWMITTGAPGNNKNLTGGKEVQMQSRKNDKSIAKLQAPGMCTIDAAGRLLVVDALDFSITAFSTKNGTFMAKYGDFGQDEGKFMYPSGIDYDPVRDWVAIADTMNNRVQIVRLPGTGGSSISGLSRLLAGPLRACLFPLALLIIAAIAYMLWRRKQKRDEAKARRAAEAAAARAAQGEFVGA